jgi:hypothetical protein
VLFSPVRDANPFFHFMEGLWMLGGRDDLAFPMQFNKRFNEYSDDGLRLNGAYGHRWRVYFGKDQLKFIVRELRQNKESRRAVLGMWSPSYDLGSASKDIPCNTHIYFDCRSGVLNMLVCCRSNDAMWGAYGANAVHMSMLHEGMAAWIGIPVGIYRQMSNNLHIYTNIFSHNAVMDIIEDTEYTNPYILKGCLCDPYAMVVSDMEEWLRSLDMFLLNPLDPCIVGDPFFTDVAVPMFRAWSTHKQGNTSEAVKLASEIKAEDWCLACVSWLLRREKRKESK